jgi:hypothetical protein
MKKSVKIILVLYLLTSIVFSIKRQHYFPIDGDLPSIACPDEAHKIALSDPFGINVILHDSVYCGPNRFFIHWGMLHYFHSTPKALQLFLSPIESIYYACAIAKTFFQFFLVYLLAVYATNRKKFWDDDLLLACALVNPLFQVYGFNWSMGIIDHSITYSFFYAFALSLLLLFFLPFFRAVFWQNEFRFGKWKILILIILSVLLSFNGPLNPPVTLLVCSSILFWFLLHNFKRHSELGFAKRIGRSITELPSPIIIVFGFAIVFCLYSLYIGLNNSENDWATLSLGERYSRLPYGFYLQLTADAGLPMLLLLVIANSVLIKINTPAVDGKKYFLFLKWLCALCIIYLLLLPLGGDRSYRPDLIRYDTFMPVTLALILFYAISTFHLVKKIQFKGKKIYLACLIIIICIFIFEDTRIEKENKCEKLQLKEIAASSDTLIVLQHDCAV